jgi:predicted component of type VI protein secretion system
MQNINLFAMPMTILFLLISGCVSTTTRADRAKSINAKKSTVAQFNPDS